MQKYILKRLLLFVPTVVGVSIGIFAILRIVPGDVAATILRGSDRETNFTEEQRLEVVKSFGLDKPLHEQYLIWIWGAVRFDLGDSWYIKKPIVTQLKRQFPVTVQVAVLAALMVALVAVPIGVLAAVYQDRWPDYILRSIGVVGLAMPNFFTAIVIVIVLSRWFNWLPPLGFSNLWDHPVQSLQQLFFPAVALAFTGSGTLLRLVRAQMLEILRDDYVRTARAKGLSERVVVLRHALRNALIPVVTLYGFQVAALLGGTVVIEQIFSIPGMGSSFIDAVFLKDLPVVQAYVLYIVVVALAINLIVDLTYAWLDPRIKYR